MPTYMEDIRELMEKGCQTPGCKHKHTQLHIVARCHPKAKLEARLDAERETIAIQCSECQQSILELKIATRGKQALIGL